MRVELSAHGSSTGFAALLERHAELAAASRPVKDSEVRALAGFGDLRSPYAEQVIAIDGLAIILHPDNPLASLDTAQLAAVFAGEVHTWEELGGKGGAIRLYARDEQSGTYDTLLRNWCWPVTAKAWPATPAASNPTIGWRPR